MENSITIGIQLPPKDSSVVAIITNDGRDVTTSTYPFDFLAFVTIDADTEVTKGSAFHDPLEKADVLDKFTMAQILIEKGNQLKAQAMGLTEDRLARD